MNEDQFKAIDKKLDVISRLLAVGALSGKPLKEQVMILSGIGLQPKQIADIVGKTPHHVSVILHEVRKEVTQEDEEGSTQIPPANQEQI